MKFAVPFGIFTLLSVFLFLGLGSDPRYVPSPLIDQPAPEFRGPELEDPARTFASADMKGRVWLLNVWASWCVSCRTEHEVLTSLARSGVAPVYGLDYKDERDQALSFLKTFGDPYVATIQDPDGRVGIDYGVYGVPETYVIDRDGRVRYKQVGAITQELVERTIIPLVSRLQQ